MDVEISPHVRDTAAQLGAGVPYALKVISARLADDPDMGLPSGLPGILTVTVAGDLFEGCPALAIGYIREPERTEIRYVALDPSAEAATDTQDQRGQRDREHQQQEEKQGQSSDPASVAITVRQVADAWHRITGWLQKNAPDSYAALRARPTPAPSPLWKTTSAFGYPWSCACCGC